MKRKRKWLKFRENTERNGESTAKVYSEVLTLIPERKLKIDVSPLNTPGEMSLPEISHRLSLNTGKTLEETLVHSENMTSTLLMKSKNCPYSPFAHTNIKDSHGIPPINTDNIEFTRNTNKEKYLSTPKKTLPSPKVFTNSLTRNNVHPDPRPPVNVNNAPETEKIPTDVLNVKLPSDSKSFVVVRNHSESGKALYSTPVKVPDSQETIVNTACDKVSENRTLYEKLISEQQTKQQTTKTVIERTKKSMKETTRTEQQKIYEQKNILTVEQKQKETLGEPDYEKLGAKPKIPKKCIESVP